MDLKMQLQQRLVANVIIDKCALNNDIIFRDSWCTQDRIIRFTTPFFRSLFQPSKEGSGHWKTGDFIMYEVYLKPDSFSVACLLCEDNSAINNKHLKDRLLCFNPYSQEDGTKTLRLWNYDEEENTEYLFESFDKFLSHEIPEFEKEITEFFDIDLKVNDEFTEGNKETVTGTKYERNPKARAACLAYHGTACVICGIDFAKAYGKEFAGKIEVHHIVPISQIGVEYVVDPVNDLVPVCPNCHTAIHSKKNGVYSIEEMKKIHNS